MKLPFTFGNRLIFRLILPGFLLAISFFPLVSLLGAKVSGEEPNASLLIPLLTFFFGWLITLSDMGIYMLFEGRQFWPNFMREWGIRREQKRLNQLLGEANKESKRGNHRRSTEQYVKTSRFPLNYDGERHAATPTRLGNAIYEYEFYPLSKYGLDSVFFFYRLWTAIDHDLRRELDERQAFADSAVYGSFAFAIMWAFFFSYTILTFFAPSILHFSATWWIYLIISVCAGLFSRFAYFLSIEAHIQYGEFYKSIFDQYRDRLNLDDVAEYIMDTCGPEFVRSQDRRDVGWTVWRFLRWHLVRGTDEISVNFEIAKKRAQEKEKPDDSGNM